VTGRMVARQLQDRHRGLEDAGLWWSDRWHVGNDWPALHAHLRSGHIRHRRDFPAAGDYAFVVDASDQASLKVTVEPYVDVFVRGKFNDWARPTRCSTVGKVVPADRAFSGSTNFKIANFDWTTVDCGGGSGGLQVTIGTPFAMKCGPGTSDVGLPTGTGTYRFDFTHQLGTTAAQVLVTGP